MSSPYSNHFLRHFEPLFSFSFFPFFFFFHEALSYEPMWIEWMIEWISVRGDF